MTQAVAGELRMLTIDDEQTVFDLLDSGIHSYFQPYPGDLRWVLAQGLAAGVFSQSGGYPGMAGRWRLDAALGLTWPMPDYAWLGFCMARNDEGLAQISSLREQVSLAARERGIRWVHAALDEVRDAWLPMALAAAAAQSLAGLRTMQREITPRDRSADVTTDIRSLGEEHISGVLSLERQCFPGWAQHNEGALRAAAITQTRSFVLLRDGVVAGYCLAGQRGAHGMLIRLAVDPRQQRHGIGTALLSRLLVALARNDAEGLLLNVEAENERAIAFYRKHGFSDLGMSASALRWTLG